MLLLNYNLKNYTFLAKGNTDMFMFIFIFTYALAFFSKEFEVDYRAIGLKFKNVV